MLMSPNLLLDIILFWVALYVIALPLRSKGIKVSLFYVEISAKPERVPGISEFTNLLSKFLGLGPIILAILMALSTYFLFDITLKSLTKPSEAAPAVVPIIPGVTVSLDVPILLSIFLTLFPHEMGHVMASLNNGVPVKRISFFLLLVIPGAFVEPDEESIKLLERRSRINIFSSGVLMNALTALTFLLILLAIFPSFPSKPSGLYVMEVQRGSPSYGILPNNFILTGVNGYEVKSLDDLHKVLSSYSPGDVITIRTNLGDFRVKLGESPYEEGRPWIGIKISPFPYYNSIIDMPPWFAVELLRTLILIILFNISVGGLNSLPMYPLDGYLVTKEYLISKFKDEKVVKGLLSSTSLLFALLLAYNVLLFFIR